MSKNKPENKLNKSKKSSIKKSNNILLDHFIWTRLEKEGYPTSPVAWSSGFLPHIYSGFLVFPPNQEPDFCPVEYKFSPDFKAYFLVRRPDDNRVLFSTITTYSKSGSGPSNLLKNHSVLLDKSLLSEKKVDLFHIVKAVIDYDKLNINPIGVIPPIEIESHSGDFSYLDRVNGVRSCLFKSTLQAIILKILKDKTGSQHANLTCPSLSAFNRLRVAIFLTEMLDYDTKSLDVSFTTEAPKDPEYNDFFSLAVTKDELYLPRDKDNWLQLDYTQNNKIEKNLSSQYKQIFDLTDKIYQ